jgi:hypothetical protein
MAEKQKEPSGRVRRQPVGIRNRLSVRGQDPNYNYRFVNDQDDRVSRFQEAGYEFVPNSEVKIGDNRVDIDSTLGTNASVSVGNGMRAYLMRQKKEWYDEDQKLKQDEIDKSEAGLKKPDFGAYGELKIEH